MTLVRFNQRPIDKKVNSFIEEFFNHLPARGNDELVNSSVPVNIRETENAYLIEVVAPGMDKGDFKVNVDTNILTISAEKKTEINKGNERMVRREYTYKSFARTFTLDDSISADNIKAKYENGVLNIELPKKEEVKIQPKEISIQ